MKVKGREIRRLHKRLPECPDVEVKINGCNFRNRGNACREGLKPKAYLNKIKVEIFFIPVVHYVRDDGGEEAEQHDRRAGIHDRVQKLPRVWGERQHLLQILRQKKKRDRGK